MTKRVFICCRWSKEDSGDNSLADQERIGRRDAAAFGWDIAGVAAHEISGKTMFRPDITAATDLILRDAVDVIWYKDSSRFTRNDYATEQWFEQVLHPANEMRAAAGKGPIVIHFNSGVQGDESDPNVWFSRKIIRITDEKYRRDLSRKVKIAHDFKLQDGYYIHKMPFGAKLGEVKGIPVKDASYWAAELVFEWYARGESLTAISRELKRRNVPTAQGGQWYASAVRSILRSRFYDPDAGWKHKCTMPREWYRAAQIGRRTGPIVGTHVFVLNGLLYCPHYTVKLPGKYTGQQVPMRGINRSGCLPAYVVLHKHQLYDYYSVDADEHAAAFGISTRADKLEQRIVEAVAALAAESGLSGLYGELRSDRDFQADGYRAEIASLQAELADAEARQVKLWNRAMKALDSDAKELAKDLEEQRELGKARSAAIPGEIEKLQQAIAALPIDAQLKQRSAIVNNILAAWVRGDRAGVRDVLLVLLERIEMSVESIAITWRLDTLNDLRLPQWKPIL